MSLMSACETTILRVTAVGYWRLLMVSLSISDAVRISVIEVSLPTLSLIDESASVSDNPIAFNTGDGFLIPA